MKFNFTLKKQFFILIAIQILFGIIIQSYYSINLDKLLYDRQKEYADNNEDKTISILENKQETLQYIGETLVINSLHQDYFTETDPLNRAEIIIHIESNFYEICERNRDIFDIKILSPEGNILVEKEVSNRFILMDMLKDYPLGSIKSDMTTRFYYDNYNRDEANKTMYLFYVSPIYSTTEYTGKALGYVVITWSLNNINRYLEKSVLSNNSGYVIVDGAGRVGAASDPALLNGRFEASQSDDSDIYLTERTIAPLGWILYTITSFSNIQTDINPVINNGVVFSVLALFFMVVSSIFIFNSIVAPLKKLVQELRDLPKRKSNQILSSTGNEIDLLSREINTMLLKIDESNLEIREKSEALLMTKVEKKRAQLQALQSQINPHFLYNTLESIRMMSLTDDRKETARAIKILASLFRYTTRTGTEEVTFGEELNHVRDYGELLKIRYEDNVVIEYIIDESLKNCRTLKFTLQPIVENAFQHGLNNKKGTIRIELSRSGEKAVFSVVDSGAGIPKDELALLMEHLDSGIKQKTGSIGLYNVNKRIKLKYGKEYGLDIESIPHAGTRVSVYLPIEVE